ncbi:MAG: ATP-binding cassette domain-containing protein, partial [Desulfobacteraceae bacterium]
MANETLIEVENLKVHFPVYSKGLFRRVTGHVRAVDGLSFTLGRGETLGLVGESGSGKTTIGRAILRALQPTDGRITFNKNDEAVDLTRLEGKALKHFRRHMQLIFQDPYASLNPR